MTNSLEPVEIRTTRGHDWVWVVAGTVMWLLMGYGGVSLSDVDLQSADGIKGEGIYLLLERLVGVTGIRIFLIGLALYFGLNAVAAVWRLKDGRLALWADERGLVFHPTFCASPLKWSDVESVELGGRRPAKITIRLKKRFWSLTNPLAGRNVELNIIAIGSSYRNAKTQVGKMRNWLKA